MKKLSGLVTAMLTPMTRTGKVDYEAVKRLTDFLVNNGVDGLYPCGTTGEMLALSIDERKLIAHAVVDACNSRIPVFIHCGASNIQDTIALCKDAVECGADGVGIVTPMFYKISDDELYHYYCHVLDNLPRDFPVYLYSIPQCASNSISIPVLKRLTDRYENIIGIKYSYADLYMTLDYLRIKAGFSVLHGHDRFFTSFAEMGCDGVISGISTVFPGALKNAYTQWILGNHNEALDYQRKAIQITETVYSCGEIPGSKAAMKWRGLAGSTTRYPLHTVTAKDEKILFNKLDVLSAELGENLMTKL